MDRFGHRVIAACATGAAGAAAVDARRKTGRLAVVRAPLPLPVVPAARSPPTPNVPNS
jgi:hypothetical protein